MNWFKKISICALFVFLHGVVFSQSTPLKNEAVLAQKKEEFKEQIVETEHQILLVSGEQLKYKASCGTLLLKDEEGEAKASVFFISYFKQKEEKDLMRPVTFCFNGGPGSSSIWLHMGAFGPKIVSMDSLGKPQFPYHSENNPYTLLAETDLVFIDPVSTGYSRSAPGETDKQFHGVDEDIQSVAEFIRIFTTRYNLWEAPKFIAGESYGTTRAAGLAKYLHKNEALDLNGVILISSILDFQTLFSSQNNTDLPYLLFLPSYAAAAYYHKKVQLAPGQDFKTFLKEVEDFALGEYALALLKGDLLTLEEKKKISSKLAHFIGLSQEYIERANLRINIYRFVKELLRFESRSIGRFDSRILGFEFDHCAEMFESDPSFDILFGAYSAVFHHYIKNELNWISDEAYKVLADVFPWNYGKAINQYLNVADALRYTIHCNPSLRVFVGSGFNDLATPYFATDYTFNHLGLEPALRSNIVKKYYNGGHMMYTYKPSLVELNQDISNFIQSSSSLKTLAQ